MSDLIVARVIWIKGIRELSVAIAVITWQATTRWIDLDVRDGKPSEHDRMFPYRRDS